MMTCIADVRSFIAALREAGQLACVEREVSLQHELANVAATVLRRRGTAVLFEHPSGSPWRVFSSNLATRKIASIALGCEPDQISDVMAWALEPDHGIEPQCVPDAPWKQHGVSGKDVDLGLLPIPTHAPGDAGPFVTGGVAISKDPISGRGNLSYNRLLVLGPHTLGFHVNEWRDVMRFYKIQETKGEPLPVAIAIGLSPSVMIAGAARSDDDELRIAGAIRGEAVPVSSGVTVDVNIPTEAEIVVEGYIPPNDRQAEGPMAEFHGYYGERWQSPVMEVTGIWYRSDPIFQTIIPGLDEHVYLGNVLTREPLLLRFVRHVSKNVTDLYVPPYANGFLAIVQLEKSNPGEPRNVALAAFTAHVNVRQVIVVDPDVDIHDPVDLLWALTSRVDWSQDFFTIPKAQGHQTDPAADVRGVHTKVGIDATYKPERRPYGPRARYPEVDLGQYIANGSS